MFHTFLHSETVIFHHLAFVGAKIFHTMYLLLERMIWWVTCFSKESENWNGKRKEKKVKECLFLCSLSLSSLLLGHFYFAPCRNAMICGHTQISVIMCKMIFGNHDFTFAITLTDRPFQTMGSRRFKALSLRLNAFASAEKNICFFWSILVYPS